MLCGRDDAWSQLQAHRELAALIPDSRLVSIAECGHMAPMERPQAVSQAMRSWLESLRPT